MGVLLSTERGVLPQRSDQCLGLETVMSGFGRSDAAYNHLCFCVRMRYAVGHQDSSERSCDLCRVYNCRRCVAQHMQETGENLIECPFEQVADGGYSNPKLDTVMRERRVQQIQKLSGSISHHAGIWEKERH